MKVLGIHNFYQQAGGEEAVFEDEAALLESHNHTVIRYTIHNDSVSKLNPIKLASSTIWNQVSCQALTQLVQQKRPQIAHFHNTFPLISPSAYYGIKSQGIPVVQTLHNYRLLCPSATFFRNGQVCEDCIGKYVPLPAVQHACYRDNRFATTVVATMLTSHRVMQTWDKVVDLYIALTDFSREKFIEGGLPAERIVVKPNFVHPDPLPGGENRDYALFVGRLSPEKGIDTLLSAWKHLESKLPLKIVGDGPLAEQVTRVVEKLPGITWLGRRPQEEVYRLMGEAKFLVFPSVWYEGMPRSIVEAFAKGTPVVASNFGTIPELIEDGRTGLLFRSGDAEDLVRKIEWLLNYPNVLSQMQQEARLEFENKYTAEKNYQQLMEIYQIATSSNSTINSSNLFF